MDQNTHNPEVYDFRQYDRIWQRVAPNLEPYPGMMSRSESAAPAATAPAASAAPGLPAVRPMPEAPAVPAPAVGGALAQLPGAEPNPCCMGSAAMELLGVIEGYMEVTRADRRYLLALAAQAPSWARQTLREIASDLQGQFRQLMAAYYLITGQSYRPSVSAERIYVGRWCPALRERYHSAACSGLNFARSAEDTTDPCLAKLFEDLSKEAYGHAGLLMGLLERQLGMRN